MTERSILITGCSSGIGAHCARALKRRGWRVFATARKAADLAALETDGLEAVYLDYAEPRSIADCAEAVLARTDGRIDALFNNGAYGQPGAVEDLTADVLRTQFEVNVIGWHDLTRRMVAAMRANGGGRIVQVSSVLGMIGAPYRGAYCASKFALEGLTDTLRMELSGTGIHVSLIEPGPIWSRFVEHALEALKANIDIEGSIHAETYQRRLASMKKGGSRRFKLGPEAVMKRAVHALESSRPKARYYVTMPTYVVAGARRLLPASVLDRFMTGRYGRKTKPAPSGERT